MSERDPHNRTGGEPPAGAAPPTRIGRFEVREALGHGAFGHVYRAFDPELHRDVAVKVPHGAGLTPEFRERFLREARAAATIRHPNVCPVYEVGTDGERPFIVMAFVKGPTLATLLAQQQGTFPPRFAVPLVRKLALGVAAAHAQGVIHRDLKPGNVLWDAANREVLITDFGLARLGAESDMTAEGLILGTPAYMAPEQARARQAEVGPSADVYALGVILYELLTGELPFQGSPLEVLAQAQFADPQPPSAVRPGLDPALDAVCRRAMAKTPEDRFASAREFATALADYLRGQLAVEVSDSGFQASRTATLPLTEDAPAPPVTLVEPLPSARVSGLAPQPEPQKQPRRKRAREKAARPSSRRLWAIAACAAVLVIGGVAYVVVSRPTPGPTADTASPAKPPGPAAVEWKEFRARKGGFKVSVPGDPVELDLPALGLFKGKGKGFSKSLVIGGQIVTAASGTGEVAVKAIGVHFAGGTDFGREKTLEELSKVTLGGGSSGRGDVRSRREVTWLGQKTEEVVMAFPTDPGSEPTETAYRTAIVGSYGYIGAISGKHGRADPEHEKRFFDTFEVLR